MPPKKYQGVVVPAVTPLTENLRLDETAVERMFANFYLYQIQPFILGTTGESVSLPQSLKNDFIKKASQCPHHSLYVGIGSNCVEESVEMSQRCGDAGVDVVVATVPSYYALTESQIKRYFERLADASPCPLVIYNIPATTHLSLPLSVIDELSYHPNIVGTKDSERSDERLSASIQLWKNRADFSHFVGWAAKSAEALLSGSDGIIPSTANFDAALYHDLWQAVQAGDSQNAMNLQQKSDDLGNLYQQDRTLGESLAALKLLMSSVGLCQPFMMPPL